VLEAHVQTTYPDLVRFIVRDTSRSRTNTTADIASPTMNRCTRRGRRPCGALAVVIP
jgi:hypothetical protein